MSGLCFKARRTVVYAAERFGELQDLIKSVLTHESFLKNFFLSRPPTMNPTAHEEQDFRRTLRTHAHGINSTDAIEVEKGVDGMNEGITSDLYDACLKLAQR